MCVICHDTHTTVVLCIPQVTVPRPPALHLLFLHSECMVPLCWGTCPPAAGLESSSSSETHGGKEIKADPSPPCCAPFHTALRALLCWLQSVEKSQLVVDALGG